MTHIRRWLGQPKRVIYEALWFAAVRQDWLRKFSWASIGCLADETTSLGDTDMGASPYGFLVGVLSMTVGMYARRKGWPLESVPVNLRHSRIHTSDGAECETKEGMLDRIERDIQFAGPLTTVQRSNLLEIAGKCPIHRTLPSKVELKTQAV